MLGKNLLRADGGRIFYIFRSTKEPPKCAGKHTEYYLFFYVLDVTSSQLTYGYYNNWSINRISCSFRAEVDATAFQLPSPKLASSNHLRHARPTDRKRLLAAALHAPFQQHYGTFRFSLQRSQFKKNLKKPNCLIAASFLL